MKKPQITFTEPEKEIKYLKSRIEWYKERCDQLQKKQLEMRDPERKMVCDILANGSTNVESYYEQEQKNKQIRGVIVL